jgi:hypothetical protein
MARRTLTTRLQHSTTFLPKGTVNMQTWIWLEAWSIAAKPL